ncbi:MAG: hypothetical protein WAV25_00070 [Minisyncoccia bacterium]
MNCFEILLDKLTKKIATVRALCATIPALVPAEKARVELENLVKSLCDENYDIDKYDVGFIASEAEMALTELRRVEQLVLAEAREVESRIRDNIASGVVGSIKRHGGSRSADKRQADRDRRASMKGEGKGGGKKQRKTA